MRCGTGRRAWAAALEAAARWARVARRERRACSAASSPAVFWWDDEGGGWRVAVDEARDRGAGPFSLEDVLLRLVRGLSSGLVLLFLLPLLGSGDPGESERGDDGGGDEDTWEWESDSVDVPSASAFASFFARSISSASSS